MAGASPSSSCRGLFRRLGILTLPSLYVLETVAFFRKHRSMEGHFDFDHEHDTRYGGTLLRTPSHHLELDKKSVEFNAVR
ncbi:unnamed protein product, partial [Nesidiocoris tenuis]